MLPFLLAGACGHGDDGSSSGPVDGGTCASRAAPETTPAPLPRHTPKWAFEPWISKDISSTDDTYDFVQGFADRDIPVGAVVLDSPWETHYNTFVPNPTRYHDFPKLVSDMHARGVKVVLWIVPMVNTTGIDLEPGAGQYDGEAPNYEEGLACNYYVNGGQTTFWWKGFGSAIDFFDPSARAWWHAQQDAVLNAGVDGWKLDFAENYLQGTTVSTVAGVVPLQTYSEAYYQDFFAHGQAVRGADFVTMTRAWDESYSFPGRFFARPEHSVVAWMGDNRRDWIGLADALDEMFRSAKAGYTVVGSDIGGYLDHDDKNLLGPSIPFDTTVFARWTAVGALSPFMQLHGRANIAPWTVPDHVDEIVALYRKWAKLHHALVPWLYARSVAAHAAGTSLVEPLGGPGDYRYVLGGDLLVAPVLDTTGKRDVALPAGARWYDGWMGDGTAHDGGTTIPAVDVSDIATMPVLVREGAILPLNVEDDADGLGTSASKGATTVLAFPTAARSTFDAYATEGNALEAQPSTTPTIWRVRVATAPASVSLDGALLTSAPDAASFDAATSAWRSAPPFVWIKQPPHAAASRITLDGS